MSFLPCMFLVNELQRLDPHELISYLLCKRPPQPVLFFLQPRGGPRCEFVESSVGRIHYDAFELPSVLPAMDLIRPTGREASR